MGIAIVVTVRQIPVKIITLSNEKCLNTNKKS